MSLIFVIPSPGTDVRTEDGQVIPPDGALVHKTKYIQRRIAFGSLVEGAAFDKSINSEVNENLIN
jgi:hypothetical protein